MSSRVGVICSLILMSVLWVACPATPLPPGESSGELSVRLEVVPDAAASDTAHTPDVVGLDFRLVRETRIHPEPAPESLEPLVESGVSVEVDTKDAGGQDVLPETGPELPPEPTKAKTYQVGSGIYDVTDKSRSRTITYKVYFPKSFTGLAAVILVSHGGTGSTRGHNALSHLGSHYASRGYLAIHIGHRQSKDVNTHQSDRPADVSLMVDQLEAGTLTLPAGFGGKANMKQVGHVGHSWGAYTAHAVAGAKFVQGTFRDSRIKAIVALSPQGKDQFGSFDRGASDNTWLTVEIPAYSMFGSDEKDRIINGKVEVDWRGAPFRRYPTTGDKYQSVLDGQGHTEMGSQGSAAVQRYIAYNSRAFFDVYLRGARAILCDIGKIALLPKTDFKRKFVSTSPLASCP